MPTKIYTKNLGTLDRTLRGIIGVSLIVYGIFCNEGIRRGFGCCWACSSCDWVDEELPAVYIFLTQYRRRKTLLLDRRSETLNEERVLRHSKSINFSSLVGLFMVLHTTSQL